MAFVLQAFISLYHNIKKTSKNTSQKHNYNANVKKKRLGYSKA